MVGRNASWGKSTEGLGRAIFGSEDLREWAKFGNGSVVEEGGLAGACWGLAVNADGENLNVRLEFAFEIWCDYCYESLNWSIAVSASSRIGLWGFLHIPDVHHVCCSPSLTLYLHLCGGLKKLKRTPQLPRSRFSTMFRQLCIEKQAVRLARSACSKKNETRRRTIASISRIGLARRSRPGCKRKPLLVAKRVWSCGESVYRVFLMF